MKYFISRRLFIIVLFGVAVFIIGALYIGRAKKPSHEFIVAARGDLVQEVSVTGKIKSSDRVNLAFEKSGKVSGVFAAVGDKVASGQKLVTLESGELAAQLAQAEAGVTSAKAQLAQYQAALENQQAKLDELKRGTRPEEIQIAETNVANAKKVLADAEINLVNVKSKANTDLASIYDDVKNILHDAYAKADDAVNKQTDEMFTNDTSSSPQLTFITSEVQTEIDAKSKRLSAGASLAAFKAELGKLPSDYSGLDRALVNAENHLVLIRDFLNRLTDAVNAASGLSSATSSSYKGSINTGRANVNTALSNISNQKQLIASQNVTNQSNVSAGEANVSDAKNALASAEDELALKKAGATQEQIAAQEAQVKQAEANISSQKAKIEQARADARFYQTQIEKTILRSPFGGIVAKQDAKIGEIVSPNAPLVLLISEAMFEIEANVPEADIAKVSIGNPAGITLDAYGSEVKFDAKVIAVDPAETIVEGVATYKITLQFIQEDGRIKSGMTANIDVLTDKRENVIAVPQRAVITKNGGKIVRVLNEDGTVGEARVVTGLRGSSGAIEIVEGVKEGDKVIIFVEEK